MIITKKALRRRRFSEALDYFCSALAGDAMISVDDSAIGDRRFPLRRLDLFTPHGERLYFAVDSSRCGWHAGRNFSHVAAH